jgi:tRNA(fMet)-specific endonuclease VapC
MGLSHMLDTSMCALIMNADTNVYAPVLRRHDGAICISSVVYAELRYGLEKSIRQQKNAEVLADFLALVDILEFGELAAEHYGVIRNDLLKAGTPIINNDLLIAAHARSEGLTLVTNNRREFDRVPALKVENWAI